MKNNELKIGVILSYVQIFLGALISIFYIPFLLKQLGDSEYGVYNLSISVVSYLSLLNFGFSSSYIRFFSKFKVKNNTLSIAKLNSIFLLIFLILGAIAFIIGIVLSYNIGIVFAQNISIEEIQKIRILIIILSFNMGLSFPASLFISYVGAKEKFLIQKLLNMMKIVLIPIMMIPILILGYKSIMLAIVTVIITFVIDLLYFRYCIKQLKMKFYFKDLEIGVIKEVTLFTSFIAINLIIDQINWNLDQLFLGRFHGTMAVTIYSLASIINKVYLNFTLSISSVFIPKINNLISMKSESEEIDKLFIKVGRIQFMVLMLINTGFIFFGKVFIHFWVGESYIDIYYIVLLLILPLTVPGIQNLGIEIQRAYNQHQFRSKVYLIMALINILISIPLSIQYEGIGAAVGTAISLIIANGIIMNIYYHNKMNMNIVMFWRSILSIVPALIIPIAVGILIYNYITLNSVILLAMYICLYSIIYILSIFSWGMNEEEKNMLNISRIWR